MPKLNKHILQALVWDIQEIIKINNSITSWIDDKDLFSGFPLITSNNIIDFVTEKTKTAGEQYICLLEIFHDKIRYYLCALVNYIEKISGIKCNSTMKFPRNLTMASLSAMIWNKIQKFNDKIYSEKVPSIKRNIWSMNLNPVVLKLKGYNLPSCQCCEASQISLKMYLETLNLHFENNGVTTNGVTEMRKTFDLLWEKYDYWFVVIEYIEALKNDLEVMVNNYNLKNDELEKAGLRSNEIQVDLASKINLMSEEVIRLQNKMKKESKTLECLRTSKSQIELQLYQSEKKNNYIQGKLSQKQSQIDNLDKKVREFEKVIEENQILKNSEAALQDLVDSFEEQRRVMEEKLTCLEFERQNGVQKEKKLEKEFEEKRQTLLTQYRNSKSTASVMKSEVARLNHSYQQLQEDLQGKIQRAQKLLKENRRLEMKVDELNNKLFESERKMTVLLKNPDMNGPIIYDEVCHPAKDMQNQIEANKLRVKLLEKENHYLEGVIIKLKTKPSKEELRISL